MGTDVTESTAKYKRFMRRFMRPHVPIAEPSGTTACVYGPYEMGQQFPIRWATQAVDEGGADAAGAGSFSFVGCCALLHETEQHFMRAFQLGRGKDAVCARLENASRFSLFPPAPTTGLIRSL